MSASSSSAQPTTTKTDALAAANSEKGTEKEDGVVDMEKQLIDSKHAKFNELIGWLQKWGYKVADRSKENRIQGIQFTAEISPLLPYSSGASTPFFLEFQNDLDDGLIIRTSFELDKNIDLYLKNQKRAREMELVYLEIEQIVLPMKISMMRRHPVINIYKIVFLEGLTKQFFYDCINDLVNAMSMIIGKWDQKYYEIRPKSPEGEPSKR